jgi:uncharacterized protein (DUF169 family)
MKETMTSITEIQEMGHKLTTILGLSGSAVGVRLLAVGAETPAAAEPLHRHRYCQAVMKARHGQHVLLDSKGIACPAAAAAFGFKPLPEGLRNGNGLVGFGFVSDPATGQGMNLPIRPLKSNSAMNAVSLRRFRHEDSNYRRRLSQMSSDDC